MIDKHNIKNCHNGDGKQLVFPFADGKAVEKAADGLETIQGEGTLLGDKYKTHNKQAFIRVAKVASQGGKSKGVDIFQKRDINSSKLEQSFVINGSIQSSYGYCCGSRK